MKATVEAIAQQFGITKKLAKEVVDATIESLTETLVTEGKVKVTGLGSFSVKTKPERAGRNPKDGTPLTIKEHKVVKFTLTKSLKVAVQ
jgi:DNA-binding protein HU-beta